MKKKNLCFILLLIVSLGAIGIYFVCKQLTFSRQVVLRNTIGTLTITTENRSLAKAKRNVSRLWKIVQFSINYDSDVSLLKTLDDDILSIDEENCSVEYFELHIHFEMNPYGSVMEQRFSSNPLHISLKFEKPVLKFKMWVTQEDIRVIGSYSKSMVPYYSENIDSVIRMWNEISDVKNIYGQEIEFDFKEIEGTYRYPTETVVIAMITDNELE